MVLPVLLASGGGRHCREGRRAGVHQFYGLGHDLDGFFVLGDTAQLVLPEVQVLLGQGVQIGWLRHGISDLLSDLLPASSVPS
ncbi:MAG: hypothetical protein IIC06_07790 [Proteobacteria bacterium]|nr:hypothetical protein [Pseudomonadota bacterium]